MALGNILGRLFLTRSIYLRPQQRYVVSLMVGYPESKVKSPEEAAAAALAMTLDKDSDSTTWFVHDLETREVYALEQKQFENIIHEKGWI